MHLIKYFSSAQKCAGPESALREQNTVLNVLIYPKQRHQRETARGKLKRYMESHIL